MYCCLLLIYFVYYFRYIEHPAGENVTKSYLESGKYEIEAMGIRYPAKVYLQSPFDPENKRLQGHYS